MAYRKVISGTANQSNESDSHDRIQIGTIGNAGMVFVVYVCLLITASILFMWIAHANILQALVCGSFVVIFIIGWYLALRFVIMDIHRHKTEWTINQATQEQSLLKARIAVESEHYVLYKDFDGAFAFHGMKEITENHHFPAPVPSQESPSDWRDAALVAWDGGSSARSIEKYLNQDRSKENKITYHQIQKVLDLYRPGWRDAHKKGGGGNETYPIGEE